LEHKPIPERQLSSALAPEDLAMTEEEPKDPNFTLVGAIAAAVIVAGYAFMLHTSGYFKEVPKTVETDKAKASQQR
jgi:hypothetical protein